MNGPAQYTTATIALHWTMAVLLVATFALGVYMAGLTFSPLRVKLFNWHKWSGIVILALAALRLGARLFQARPAEHAMPRWQQLASRLSHALLYVLFFAVPLAGWAYSSAAGVPLVWFGMLPLPALLEADNELAELLKAWHGTLAWTLAAVTCVHVAAALKHHFIDHDRLLLRMIPQRTAKEFR